jgi:hypothetical protein
MDCSYMIVVGLQGNIHSSIALALELELELELEAGVEVRVGIAAEG